MRKIFQSALFLLAFLPAVSFAQDKKITWPEMEQFHSYMSATFHPAEEGNFAPLKEKSDSLFKAAKAWRKSVIPTNFKPLETKEALTQLVVKCAALSKAVQARQTNEQLKKLITEAHDVFHTIMGECRKSGE